MTCRRRRWLFGSCKMSEQHRGNMARSSCSFGEKKKTGVAIDRNDVENDQT